MSVVRSSFKDKTFSIVNERDVVNEFADEANIREAHFNVGPGDTVIDVGVSYGSYALTAMVAGADVVGVEPVSKSVRTFLESVLLNLDLRLGRLTLVQKALYDGGPYPPELMRDFQEPVDIDTLDGLVDSLGLKRVDFVKVDVEGAELGVLLGGFMTLQRFKPRLIVEDHTMITTWQGEWARKIHSAPKVEALLAGLGYGIKSEPYMGRRLWIAE